MLVQRFLAVSGHAGLDFLFQSRGHLVQIERMLRLCEPSLGMLS